MDFLFLNYGINELLTMLSFSNIHRATIPKITLYRTHTNNFFTNNKKYFSGIDLQYTLYKSFIHIV